MTEEAQQMIEHIVRLIRKPGVTVDQNTALVSSGLIDSMSLIDLLVKLEDLTHLRIPAGTSMPARVRAYVVTDVFPLGRRDF